MKATHLRYQKFGQQRGAPTQLLEGLEVKRGEGGAEPVARKSRLAEGVGSARSETGPARLRWW